MHASALNFAIGFFGYPFDGQYEQSVTIESTGVRGFLRDLASGFDLTPFSLTTVLHLTQRVLSLRM